LIPTQALAEIERWAGIAFLVDLVIGGLLGLRWPHGRFGAFVVLIGFALLAIRIYARWRRVNAGELKSRL